LAVSTGGKVYMVIGFIVMFMGLFLSMSSLVAIFLILAGIVTMIQGYKMKSGEQYRQLPQGNNSHYNTGLSSKRDTTSRGAV